MSDYCEERCEKLAAYMLEHNATVRSAAAHFGISKSTVHKDLTTTLRHRNRGLYQSVKQLLATNKAERHYRGGEATRLMYQKRRENHSSNEHT